MTLHISSVYTQRHSLVHPGLNSSCRRVKPSLCVVDLVQDESPDWTCQPGCAGRRPEARTGRFVECSSFCLFCVAVFSPHFKFCLNPVSQFIQQLEHKSCPSNTESLFVFLHSNQQMRVCQTVPAGKMKRQINLGLGKHYELSLSLSELIQLAQRLNF